MMNKNYIIGLDIGGTKCAVTLAKRCEKAPEIYAKKQFQTQRNTPYEVLEQFMNIIDGILADNSLAYSDIYSIGISCGGPLDSKQGVIMSPPNLPMWNKIEVCDYFRSRTGIVCKLQNDANACAVAEWKYGAGRSLSNMVFLTFGTGLGAGLIIDGKLYSGTHDNAGEIGHVRLMPKGPIGYGKEGSCEGFCSGGGIAQLGVTAMLRNGKECKLYKACDGDPSKINAKMIAELADSGDEICIGVYEKCGEMLGHTLAILCDILDPEKIVIGGIFMRSSHLIIEKMNAAFSAEAICPCEIVAAGLGEHVGDYAALSVAEM